MWIGVSGMCFGLRKCKVLSPLSIRHGTWRFTGSQGRKSGASSVSSEVSSSSGASKWKSTFSPISDPKPTPPDLRQGGSPFGVGASRGGTDSDSDQKPQRRGEREREPYGNSNLFLSQDGGGRSVVNASERPLQKQKTREWDLKSVTGLASQNLFISAAASGGILSGKVGGAATVSSASSVGQYFPLGGASVLQSLFGAQAPGPATSGAPRLVNGHSALGSFSSAGLAGGAAGGEWDDICFFVLFSEIELMVRTVPRV